MIFISNFKLLLAEPEFQSLADVAIAAEKILHIDPGACIFNCRLSLEFAVNMKIIYERNSPLWRCFPLG